MITQREYVEGCLQWYREADLQPGNPEDGEWHECHYPVPKCLGGTETILLLKEHHAVQGVLQSEEYQHPCIWGWEAEFLREELLNVHKKWMRKKLNLGLNKVNQAERGSSGGQTIRNKRLGIFNPENTNRIREAQRQSGNRMHQEKIGFHGLSEEEKRENCIKGGQAAAKVQQEQKIGIFGLSYEEKVAIANKVNEKRKKKVILTHPNGTEEQVDSISEAARNYNLNRSQLQKILKGLTNGKSKGFTVRYPD
jgi:hypothetical protein